MHRQWMKSITPLLSPDCPHAGCHNPDMTERALKRQARPKRDGKTFSKPSDVRALSRDQGLVIVYLFLRSKEIRKGDTRIGFESKLGRYALTETLNPTEMIYHGKLEL